MNKIKFFVITFFQFILFSQFSPLLFCGTTENMPWHTPFEQLYNYLKGPGALLFAGFSIGGGLILLAATKGQGIGKLAWVIGAIACLVNLPNLLDFLFPNAQGFIF